MNNQPVYMSVEQINALFQRDSTYEVRDDRINSFQYDIKRNDIWKSEGPECEENRPTNQSESMMMITREEYQSLQQEYERRKDMEEKYKEDINKLMKELKQKGGELESVKRDQDLLFEQNQRREQVLQNLRQQVQEANHREQKAVIELADMQEQHMQMKQKLEIVQQKYNYLQKQHKFEIDRKDKQIDQLKSQIIFLNEDNEKLKNEYQAGILYLDSQRVSQEKTQNQWAQFNSSAYKSSIQFQKEKSITQIQFKSNYDSKLIFGKKSQNSLKQQQSQSDLQLKGQ
ncbi:unnamed protein product (macronuclear) [Paramecium tetraurelia]|uniref:Uncharacterized protein n=1 Tax=Paramecium tetraurelia TaxID=5888 RepID=A0DV35_PARTE|nr:uncharacterized protein GSPATT00020564001 [Paramecium tetraurelia]CAK86902.1 unnamed protein product [Paramecium tetraurelia]|eukprot:XP_001454299.1 hypothetical protein (macronuclear) [Paramecium tetraurelia strain d4-2]